MIFCRGSSSGLEVGAVGGGSAGGDTPRSSPMGMELSLVRQAQGYAVAGAALWCLEGHETPALRALAESYPLFPRTSA